MSSYFEKYPKIYIKDLQTSCFIITFASMKENNNTNKSMNENKWKR